MKRKIDFITNSSSSSFLVAWPNKIETIKDVLVFVPEQEKATVVFHDAIEQVPIHLEHGNFDYDFDQATKTITNDFIDFVINGFVGIVDTYHLTEPIRRRVMRQLFPERSKMSSDDWDRLEEEVKKQFKEQYGLEPYEFKYQRALELISKFLNDNKGKFIYKFNYGDEDGNLYSELEHGGTFDDLSHIHVSHH